MKLILVALALGAEALVPPLARRAAPTRVVSLASDAVVEKGTSTLDDTEGLGAEFDDAMVGDEDGEEDLLADFDLEGADVGDISEWPETLRSLCEKERAEHVITYKRHDTDCGSSEVQIALFTARIKHITQHVIDNPKDHASRRGLLALVSKRRRIMHYYNSKSPEKAV